jgi:hypothetical protein
VKIPIDVGGEVGGWAGSLVWLGRKDLQVNTSFYPYIHISIYLSLFVYVFTHVCRFTYLHLVESVHLCIYIPVNSILSFIRIVHRRGRF